MSLTVWSINGQEYELDLNDLETCERYEAAFAKVIEQEKALPKDGVMSRFIRAEVSMHRELYDNLFGKGAGIAILGEKMNLAYCRQIYLKFLDFVSAQQRFNNEFRSEISARFSAARVKERDGKK